MAPPPGSKLPIAPIHGPTNPNAQQRGSAACTVPYGFKVDKGKDIRIGTLTHGRKRYFRGNKKLLIAQWKEYCYRSTQSWLPYGFTPAAGPISNQLVKTGMSIATGWRQSGQDSFADAMIALPQSRQAQ